MAQAPLSKQQIVQYFPGCTLNNVNHRIGRVVLQLFGLLGHGKSSLINSCLSTLKGERYGNHADSASNDGGTTIERTEYELTTSLVMMDNRGIRMMTPGEMLECSAQLRGLRKLGKVNWTGLSTKKVFRMCEEQERRRGPVDLMVPVFVQRCDYNWSKDNGKEIESFLDKAYRSTGIQPIIVITHATSGNSAQYTEIFKEFGSHHIVTLENYTKKNHERNPETDGKILEFLSTCIKEAESRINGMAGEDLYERSVKEKTKQFKEESKELKKSVDRLKDLLKE